MTYPALGATSSRDAALLRVLFKQMAAVVWTTDTKLRFTSFQAEGLPQARDAARPAIGATLSAFYQSEDLDSTPIVAHRRALAGESTCYEIAGWGRWLQCFVEPQSTEQGEIIGTVGVAMDMTERLETERALREKEEEYRSIFQSTTDGLLIRNLDGIVVEVNPAHCQMSGYTREEMIGQPITKFIHPDYHHVPVETRAAIQAGKAYCVEAMSLRKDGVAFPVEARGVAFSYKGKPHLLAVVRDITERKQAEEAILRSQRRLEQRVAERTHELSTLLEISRTIASTLELKPLLGLILDQLKFVADYSGASILTLQGDELAYLDYRRPPGREHEILSTFRFQTERLGKLWPKLCQGEAVIISDVTADDPMAEDYRGIVGDNLKVGLTYARSWMAVPLLVKDRIVGTLTLAHAQTNYYTPYHAELTMAIANLAAQAIENARLFAEVEGKAALEERQRLARELHDSVSQALYGIVLGAETARAYLGKHPERLAQPINYIRSLADAGLAEMKALIFELRPESLATEGIIAALAKHAASLQARHEIGVHTDFCEEPSVALEVKEAIYRIAQEAMHNVVKHAEASQVSVRLAHDNGHVMVEVHDNGVGFAVGYDFPGHLGLKSMRERAERLGGELEVESAPGQGTTVRAVIPCPGK